MKNIYGKALTIWLLGLLGLILCDGFLRWQTGKQYALGMPESLWFGLPLVWAGVAGWVVMAAWRKNRSWQTLLKIGLTIVCAAGLYVLAIGWYIVGAGIDAF